MSTATATIPMPPMFDNTVNQISVDQYHEMIQAGILCDGDPVELFEGVLAGKTTKRPPHTLSGRLSVVDLLP